MFGILKMKVDIQPRIMCLFQQEGLAKVCLVGGCTTIQKAKIGGKLPRKRGATIAGFDKSWNSFMEKV